MSLNDPKQPSVCPICASLSFVLVLASFFASPYDFYLLHLLLNIFFPMKLPQHMQEEKPQLVSLCSCPRHRSALTLISLNVLIPFSSDLQRLRGEEVVRVEVIPSEVLTLLISEVSPRRHSRGFFVIWWCFGFQIAELVSINPQRGETGAARCNSSYSVCC